VAQSNTSLLSGTIVSRILTLWPIIQIYGVVQNNCLVSISYENRIHECVVFHMQHDPSVIGIPIPILICNPMHCPQSCVLVRSATALGFSYTHHTTILFFLLFVVNGAQSSTHFLNIMGAGKCSVVSMYPVGII
jgi:hypothetical protein